KAPAKELWAEVYGRLSADRPGLLGAVTSRGEAHVVRLSMLYALLDRCRVVKPEHLLAAGAIWDFCERSACYLFGEALALPLADELLRLLRANRGLPRTEIRDYLGRHQAGERVDQALGVLLAHRLAHPVKDQTGGRPSERWFAGPPPA